MEEFHEFRGGISTLQSPIQCKCCTSFLSWHWFLQLVNPFCIFSSLVDYRTFFLTKFHYLTTNSFGPTFTNQVIVVNKHHCSNCSFNTSPRTQSGEEWKFQNVQREECIKKVWEPLAHTIIYCINIPTTKNTIPQMLDRSVRFCL